MSFLSDFEADLFISHSPIDNQPLIDGQKGWISSFHQALKIRLAQLGAEPKLWRDPEFRGHTLDNNRPGSIPKIGVMVSVVSPPYVRSATCLREITEFSDVAEKSGGLLVDGKPRIFKVVKMPVGPDGQPPEILGLLDYEFYQIDKASGRPHELNPEINPGITQNYWLKLADLAYDIHQVLERLKSRSNGNAVRANETEQPGMKPNQVFISHASEDKEQAEKICGLLEDQGINCWIAPRDTRPGSEYAPEISDAIDNSAALVLVLSSRSNASIHVTNEVEWATSNGKPVCTVRIEDVPPSKRLAIHISTRQWVNAWVSPLDDKVNRLAAAIRELACLPGPDESVYLAETTFDLKDGRDSIRRELQQRGYNVLPDKSLPSEADAFRKAIREYLQRSRLSIHLIGDNYGDTPKGSTQSLVHLQNELAAERSGDPAFSRLIWMPPDLRTQDEKQQKFIDSLQGDPVSHQGVELLQTSLEELKSFIEETLSNRKSPPPKSPPGSPMHIYLICDQQDLTSVLPVRDCFYDLGYEAVLPAMSGDEAQIREDHKENLLMCDACLIYHGATNEFWLRSKLRDLQKSAGYGRSQPMLAKAVYIAAPETADKTSFRTLDASVIRNFSTFHPDSLKPFLTAFARTQSVQGGRS